MLRIMQSNGAVLYFKDELELADYYLEGQTSPDRCGTWNGKAAPMLGVPERVESQAFSRLVKNRHPITEEKLKPRDIANAIEGYELSIDVRKSVTLKAIYDARIEVEVREANHEAMELAETFQTTRVRKDGVKDGDRITGVALWGSFVHHHTRPTKTFGIEEPQLHIHNYFVNLTSDPEEGNRWKAAHFELMMTKAPLIQAAFDQALVRRLTSLGYEFDDRGELAEVEVPQTLIQKFSTRTKEVNQYNRDHNVTDPAEKAKAGVKTRAKKRSGVSHDELLRQWESRATPEELAALKVLPLPKLPPNPAPVIEHASARVAEAARTIGDLNKVARRYPEEEREAVRKESAAAIRVSTTGPESKPPVTPSARAAIQRACDELFEHQSVVKEDKLLMCASHWGRNQVPISELRRALAESDLIHVKQDLLSLYTRRDIVQEEDIFVTIARNSRGTCYPLNPRNLDRYCNWLTKDESAALRQILTSTDQFQMLLTNAGSDKGEIFHAIRQGARAFTTTSAVGVFAPMANTVRTNLREEGFRKAETVARLLTDKETQERYRRGVLIIDDAPALGVKTTGKLFELAIRLKARVVLVGDPKQRSVERGNTFRLLQSHAGLHPARVTDRTRQQGILKSVAEDLSSHRIDEAFEKLQRMGSLHVTEDRSHSYDLISKHYVAAMKTQKKTLIITPTREEKGLIEHAVRKEMREKKLLGRQRTVTNLIDLGLAESDRANPNAYGKGMVVQFHRHARTGFESFRAGSRWKVVGHDPWRNVLVTRKGKVLALPLKHAGRWAVFSESELSLAKGDRIRITRNGNIGRFGITNGTTYKVAGFTPFGHIRVQTGLFTKNIPKDFGHFAYGYVSTTPGEKCDVALLGLSGRSVEAAKKEHFYASVGSTRLDVHVFTDDLTRLRANLSRKELTLSALDLTGGKVPPRPSPTKRLLEKTIELRQRAGQFVSRLADASRHRMQVHQKGVPEQQHER
jgi:conjugative relaxase-like TrwC/TraI family protein